MSNLLEQASLVMIPSGYKEDIVYSEIPINGAGDLSFTRASNGTRINSQGLVEVVPWNLLQESESIGVVSPWSNSNLTITANSVIAPNGTTTADVLTETTATTTQFRTQQTTPQSTNIYTLSVYVKNITGTRQAYIDLGPVTGFFNFATETIYSASAIGSFEKLANSWYRIALTTANPITPSTIYLGLGQNNSETYTGNGTSAIAFWGAQLNIGSTAKPYFPTTDRLNVPRLTYQNGGGGCPSLLLEKQSTNIVTYSEQFDNADWNKYQCSISANQTTSPDGTQNADKLTLAGGSGTYTGLTYRLTTPGANSIFMKNDSIGNGKFYIQVDGIGNASWNANGTLASVSGGTATNGENMGNGWFRFTYVCSGGAYINYGIENGTTGDSIFIWGAQVEASSYPTSYIPTTSSSATRVADLYFKTGISSLIGQTEGTLFADFIINGFESNYASAITVNDVSVNNYVWLTIFSNGNLRGEVWNGSVQASITYSGAVVGGRYKMAFGYKTNDFVLYVNGSLVGTDTSGTTFSGTTLSRVDNDLSGIAPNNVSQSTNQLAIYKTRLTNAELASLTTI